MVLSPLTYFRLSPGRFIWGLFYMSIYFVAAWQFAQVAIGVNLLATVAMFTQMGEGHFAAKAIVILMSLVALAASIHLLVFRPYGELFRWALRRPTLHALLHDLYPLRESADAFLECVDGVDGANGRDTNGVEFAETEIDAFPYLLDAFCDELDKKLWQVRGLIRSEYQRQFLPRDWELLDRSLAASLRLDEVQDKIRTANMPVEVHKRWNQMLGQIAQLNESAPPEQSTSRKRAA